MSIAATALAAVVWNLVAELQAKEVMPASWLWNFGSRFLDFLFCDLGVLVGDGFVG